MNRAGFDDRVWQAVEVPHSWNRVGHYLPDPASHINRPETIDKEQGVGWYRLTFTPPANSRGKRAWLQFDAASRTAEVWLNGVRLGEHRGGFSRFRLDATAAMKLGEANLLVVKVDNSKPAEGSSTADVLPLAGDFFVHGGLYRPVSLVFTDPMHIDMLDFGGPGVYASTTSLDGGNAQVAVRTRLRNDGAKRQPLALVASLVDANGITAASVEQRLVLAAGQSAEPLQTLSIPAARLWQGVADPYLYTLRVELRAPSGRVLDALGQTFGVRQMTIDPARGLVLNGKPYPLHGVGYHQDREGKGWAVSASDTAEDLAIIREMGANSMRLTHYQHGQPVHDIADRLGLVLSDEIPLVSVWTFGPKQREASPALLANAKQQLTELIRQNRNHASVAVWGIANEVDFGSARPDFLGAPAGTAPDPMPLLKTLDALAKSEDPGRPTTLATCCEGAGLQAPDIPVTAVATDVAGANRYFGWYYGRPEELGPHLDMLHAKRPDQPLAVTEYGAGGAVSMHSDDPRGGPADARGRAQPEEYMAYVHELSWPQLAARPYIWASWLWNSFDFATTVRREGDADDINTKGLVTYDRKLRKDPYFFYKANWSDAPTVHVTGSRYVERAYPVTDVKVYSNAPSTELTLNGRLLGVKANCPQKVCVWPEVRLSSGANAVVATGRFASGAVSDQLVWHSDGAASQAWRIDSGALMASQASTGRFGSDAFFEGGVAGTVDKPSGWGKPPEPTPIAATLDRAIVATYREGSFGYSLPLEPGHYTVTLTFVEPALRPRERSFDVLAGGKRMLSGFDVAKAAGAPLVAIKRSFPVIIGARGLQLQFRPIKGQAIVSAVEIVR